MQIRKFFSYRKMTFLLSKSLLLRKRHHLTTKPRSLLQKRRLERCLEFSYRNHKLTPWELCKFFNNTKMTFLSAKKPPFWENNIIKRQNHGLFYRKESWKDISNFWQESWLPAPLKIWKFFDNSKMSFLRLKRLPLRK